MKLLPLITGTVGLWQFQGTLVDTSGNGNTAAVATGVEAYALMDACVQGFRFDDGTGPHTILSALIMPSTPVLRLTGEFTIQFIVQGTKTFSQSLFACLNPTASSVLYDAFINGGSIRFAFYDNAGPRNFVPATSWLPYAVAAIPIALAYRRKMTSPGIFVIDLFINGVLTASLPATSPVSDGTERLTLGGFAADAFGSRWSGSMASFRILSVARSDSDIAADAAMVLSACSPPFTYKNPLIQIRSA